MSAELVATLRLDSEFLSVEQLYGFLAISPTEVIRKGEKASPRSTSVRTTSGLRVQSDRSGAEGMEERVTWLLGHLSPEAQVAAERGDVTIDVFVGVLMKDTQAGIWVTSSLSKLLAENQCSLTFDLYPPGDDLV